MTAVIEFAQGPVTLLQLRAISFVQTVETFNVKTSDIYGLLTELFFEILVMVSQVCYTCQICIQKICGKV